MNTGGVLVAGKYSADNLAVSVSESTRKIHIGVETQVDTIWESKKKKADEEGRVCYNGISYRLNTLKEERGKIVIDFGLLEYKARQALQTIPEYLDLTDDHHHKGCYTGATVRTADDKYLIVELSGKSMNTFASDMLGGIMEKPQEIETGEDVFNCLYVELEEEARIRKEDIAEFYLRSIFLTPNTHTCFYFEVVLSVSSEELLKRFSKETQDQDIKSLKALTRDEYLGFLENHNSPTKQLVAKLLLL